MHVQPVFRKPVLVFFLLLPTFVILSLFLYYPTIKTFILSLYQVGFLGLTSMYVGAENYQTLFTDPVSLGIMKNTAVFVVCSVFFSMALGLGLSILANAKIRGGRIYRLLLIWPYALPPAVAGVIFLFLFSSQVGVVNYFLDILLGIKPDWLSEPTLAMSVVIMAAVWKNIGYNVVFYLAALQNLPGDVLEAAVIDGATAWQRFWKITFPMLSPMTFFLLIMNTIAAFFDSFAFVDLLTRGGPAGSTTVMIYSIYRDGFEYFKTGFAAAQSVFLFIIVVALTVIQFRVSRNKVHYSR
ncbi:MAG TPA: sugar ABC transporter permease [Desulfomicrobiaceae bacterium]|nr:sugar ABC transporter permease [Desulfomicrobiaceae bacterium]